MCISQSIFRIDTCMCFFSRSNLAKEILLLKNIVILHIILNLTVKTIDGEKKYNRKVRKVIFIIMLFNFTS